MVDLDNLAREFNLDEETSVPNRIDVDAYLNEVDVNDPDRINAVNLARATAILDRIIDEMNSGNFSPRMVEASAVVMGIISDISKQSYRKIYDIENLQIKKALLELKLKQYSLEKKGRVNQNIIVTDRETVLKMLEDVRKEQKLIENKGDNYDGQ